MLLGKKKITSILISLLIFCSSCSISVLSTERTDSIQIQPVTIMQWNIGHFSNGSKPYSTISDNDYKQKSEAYKELINLSNADIISTNEYSVLFSNTNCHRNCSADTLIFSSYNYKYIGNNGVSRHYSLNALFSRIPFASESTNEYEINKQSRITHTSAIEAKDYYYISYRTNLLGNNTLLISTHLAFDNNNPELAILQIKELIEKCESEEFVIICGDFNTSASSFDLFAAAGYDMANHSDITGDLATFPASSPTKPLDNILAKGFRISNPRVIYTDLSDHIPMLCEIIPYEQ